MVDSADRRDRLPLTMPVPMQESMNRLRNRTEVERIRAPLSKASPSVQESSSARSDGELRRRRERNPALRFTHTELNTLQKVYTQVDRIHTSPADRNP